MALNYQPHPDIIRLLTERAYSLSDLQAATQVSLPKLRRVVQELTASDWIRAIGQSTGTGHRPATLFGLNDRSYLIIGVHLQLPGMRLVTTDLTGAVVDEADLQSDEPLMPNDALREITYYVRRVQSAYPDRPVIGVGVATPGFVDSINGEILTIERVPTWQSLPIRSRLESTLGLPITLANDIDAIAVAELRFADSRSSDDLVYLGYYSGIKASMFLNGELYKGPFGNAGILGRMVISEGSDARLEDVASMYAVCAQFDGRMDHSLALHRDVQQTTGRRAKFQRILELAEAGDTVCAGLIDTLLSTLALSISNLLCLIQPSVLIMGGALSTMPLKLFEQLERKVRRPLTPLVSNRLVIQQARLTAPNSVALGAAHRFLMEYLDSDRFLHHVNQMNETA
jgi:predicted NBD/HSP70 family sugar kinase